MTFTDDVTPAAAAGLQQRQTARRDSLNGDVERKFAPIGASYRVERRMVQVLDQIRRFGSTESPASPAWSTTEKQVSTLSYRLHFELPLFERLGAGRQRGGTPRRAKRPLDISERELLAAGRSSRCKCAGDCVLGPARGPRGYTGGEPGPQARRKTFSSSTRKRSRSARSRPSRSRRPRPTSPRTSRDDPQHVRPSRTPEDNLRRVMAIPARRSALAGNDRSDGRPGSERSRPIDREAGHRDRAREHGPRSPTLGGADRIARRSQREGGPQQRHGISSNLNADVNLDRRRNPVDDVVPAGTPSIPNLRDVDSILQQSPTWAVGLDVLLPDRQSRRESELRHRARSTREKSEIGVRRASRRTSASTCAPRREPSRPASSACVAARKNVELQTKKLDAEQKKFDNGMSTSFEVFTFQTDLRNAQLSLIQALLDYNKSLADLERAKGTLLESKGLKLADDAGR